MSDRRTVGLFLALAMACVLAGYEAFGESWRPTAPSASPSWINGPEYDGQQVTADLPDAEHIQNIGSQRDGAGMCVMSSIEMAALYAGLEEFRGLRNWCAKESGGAYPAKVVDQIRRYCQAKGLDANRYQYLQYEGGDPAKVLELIDKTGRMAGITYGYSPRYGSRIAHMVDCICYRGKYATVLDNNFVGENRYEWMQKDELIRRMNIGGAWIFVWLAPPPPAMPRNVR